MGSCTVSQCSYVGGMWSLISRSADDKRPVSVVDIGTNVEIILGNQDWIICAKVRPAWSGGQRFRDEGRQARILYIYSMVLCHGW